LHARRTRQVRSAVIRPPLRGIEKVDWRNSWAVRWRVRPVTPGDLPPTSAPAPGPRPGFRLLL